MKIFPTIVLFLLAASTWAQDENTGDGPGSDRNRRTLSELSGRAAGIAAYTNVSLIDGTGAPVRKAASIVVDGERISAILGKDEPLPENAKVVDGTGWYAIPGLIDSHVHLATLPANDIARQHLRRSLYSGVTVVRDMAGDTRNLADLSRAARINEIESPDIYYSALMAGPSFFSDPRTRVAALGEVPGQVPWMQAITGETDLALAVALARGTGASGIKIYADLSGDLVRNIITEASRQGIPVWTHQRIFPATPFDPVEGGAVSVSHPCMIASYALQPDTSSYGSEIPPDYSRASVDDPVVQRYFKAMVEHGTILDPTLSIFPEDAGDSPPPFLCPMKLAAALTRAAHEAGVRIVAGTDSISDPDDPFPRLFGEIELLVEKAGLSPVEALQAASINGAAILGLEGSMGTLEPGKLANIMFLSSNPESDVGAIKSVVLTLKRGNAFHRSDYRHETIPRVPFPQS